MYKKKDPTDEGKVNFSYYFLLNVIAPLLGSLTNTKTFLFKLARINEISFCSFLLQKKEVNSLLTFKLTDKRI